MVLDGNKAAGTFKIMQSWAALVAPLSTHAGTSVYLSFTQRMFRKS